MSLSTTNNIIRDTSVPDMGKEEDTVPRCHSLFDLETDKLMQHNQQQQLSGKLSPEWRVSKYKICGSFVESSKGDPSSAHKPSALSQAPTVPQSQSNPKPPTKAQSVTPTVKTNSVPRPKVSTVVHQQPQQQLPSQTPLQPPMTPVMTSIRNTQEASSPILMEQVKKIENMDEVLKEKQSSVVRPPVQRQLPTNAMTPPTFPNVLPQATSLNNTGPQSNPNSASMLPQNPNPPPMRLPNIPSFPNIPLPRNGSGNANMLNPFQSNINLMKRQSMLDFQYFQNNNVNVPYGSYSSMLVNQNLFNSFLSSGSGSFSNLLSMNPNHRQTHQRPHAPGATAENHFDIDHVREVEEKDDDIRSTRPPSQNFKRGREYVQSQNSRSKKRGKWSESEDRVLQNLANAFITGNEKINFKKIADHLPGRSAKQCREHWLSTLNPDLKKGRWTKAEEIQLLDLMISHGKSWSIIAKQIPGRAEHSVKAKGRLMLGERLKSVPSNAVQYVASEVQKQRLLQLHQQLGAEYDEISKQCGFIVSPAKIERTLLTMCECSICTGLMDKIKATKTSNLLQGWTMVKSSEIKASMVKKSSKYYQQQLLSQQNSISSVGSSEEKKIKRLGSFSKLSMYKAEDEQPCKESNSEQVKEDEEYTPALPMIC